jgi:hypothetical protein
MKKSVLYLLIAFFSLTFISATKKDENKDEKKEEEKAKKKYKGILTYTDIEKLMKPKAHTDEI